MFTVDDVGSPGSAGLLHARACACVRRAQSTWLDQLTDADLAEVDALCVHPLTPVGDLWELFNAFSVLTKLPAVRLSAAFTHGVDVFEELSGTDDDIIDVVVAIEHAIELFTAPMLLRWARTVLDDRYLSMLASWLPRRRDWMSNEDLFAFWLRHAPVEDLETSISARVCSQPANRLACSAFAQRALADRFRFTADPASIPEAYTFNVVCSWVASVCDTLLGSPAGRELLVASVWLTSQNRLIGATEMLEYMRVLESVCAWLAGADPSEYANLAAYPGLFDTALARPAPLGLTEAQRRLACELADPSMTLGDVRALTLAT